MTVKIVDIIAPWNTKKNDWGDWMVYECLVWMSHMNVFNLEIE